MRGQLGTIVEFNPVDALGWIELDEGGRVRFGVTSLPREWGFTWVLLGTRVEVRGTTPGYKGVPKAVAVVPLVKPQDPWGHAHGMLPVSRPVQLFVSFAPADDAFAQCLENHLAPMESRGVVRTWSVRRMEPGLDRDSEIRARLDGSDIILLLISADFFASPACMRLVQRALEIERPGLGPPEVIPVIVRAVDWEITSFAHLRALPDNGEPVASWSNHDDAWVSVIRGIRASIKALASSRQREREPLDSTPEPAPHETATGPVHAVSGSEVIYTKESPLRLTPTEVDLLVRYLKDDWPRGTRLALHVDDGYDVHGANGCLFVGRARIYEERARCRLIEGAAEGRARHWRALYYPGATPSHAFLFQAALYFDELFVLHPGGALFRNQRVWRHHGATDDSRYEREFLDRLSRFDRTVMPLKQALVLHCVPPQMHRHPQFIKFLTSDLDDPEFVTIAGEANHQPVFVAAEKMEPLLPLVGEGGDVNSIRRELLWRSLHGGNPGGPGAARRGDLFPENSPHGVKRVTPVLGASILLNHALLTAEQYGLVPVTDDPVMARLLQRKLARVSDRAEFVDFRRQVQIKADALAMRVIEEYLPTFRFESFEHVLEARARLAEQLRLFRDAMLSLAAEIDESPYDQLFSRRVETILNAKIRPAVETLRREIQRSQDSFVAKFLRNVQAGAVPVVGLVLAGLPPSAVIAMGAGVLTAEAAIETYREVKAVKRNGFSLLLGEACKS